MRLSFVCNPTIYHYFTEYLHPLFYWLKQINVNYDVLFRNNPNLYTQLKNSDCIICIQTLDLDLSLIENPLKRVIVLNTEQNSRKTVYYHQLLDVLQKGFKVLDFHKGNMDCLNQHTNHVYQKQLLYLPCLYNPEDTILDQPKTKKICFIGTMTDYRKKILSSFPFVDVIQEFGEPRDQKLGQYKILLNLSANENYQVFETIRCYRCLYHGIQVISQEKKWKDQTPIENLVHFTSDQDLLSTIQNLSSKSFPKLDPSIFHSWSLLYIQTFIKEISQNLSLDAFL